MSEYPKVLHLNGLSVTVDSAAEEARWRETPAVEPEPVIESDGLDDRDAAPDPLDDVTIEMDNPVYHEPPKKKKAAKKK